MAEGETIFRDESLQRLFAERGFVTLKLLDPAEVPEIRKRLVAIHESRASPAGGTSNRSTYQASVMHADPDYRHRAQELAQTILAHRVAGIVRGYRFLTGGILVKAVGGDALGMHQDWTMTADPRQTSLNCWCAMVDVDARNGALELLPGSHRILKDNVVGPGIPPVHGAYEDGLKRLSQTISLRAGEAVIFDYRLLHWSRPNRSAEPRLAMVGGFIPEAAQPVLHVPDEGRGRRMFRKIEPEAESWVDLMARIAASGPSGLRASGMVRNRNRSMGREEFERRLTAPDSGAAAFAAARLKDVARRLRARVASVL